MHGKAREVELRHRAPSPGGADGLAGAFRDLLDDRIVAGVSLAEAAATLHAHPTHLVRAFRQAFGLPPHAYLTGRRVERARGLLLAGLRPAGVATAAGFYDQAHLTRHFKRYLGTAPAAFTRPGLHATGAASNSERRARVVSSRGE